MAGRQARLALHSATVRCKGVLAQVKNGSGRAYLVRLCPSNCMESLAVFWSLAMLAGVLFTAYEATALRS